MVGIENARKLDKKLMGGTTTNIEKTGFDELDNIIENISVEKPKRAKEICRSIVTIWLQLIT